MKRIKVIAKLVILPSAALLLSFSLTAASFAALSLATDFNSDPTGQLPGGADPRLPGNGFYHVPDNAATFGEIRDGIGLGATRGLVVGNRGNGNDGVIDNIKTPRLSGSAGEPGTYSGTIALNNGTTASHVVFQAEYSFRTAPTTAANVRFRSEVWGPDRNSFFGVDGANSGTLDAFAFGVDSTGNFPLSPIASNLQFGAWYRLVTVFTFLPGANNDTVNYQLFDSLNTLIGQTTTASWEEGQRINGYNGGQVFAVDALGFQARGGIVGDNAFVDDLSYSVSVAIPEVGAAALGSLVSVILGLTWTGRRLFGHRGGDE